MTFVAPRSGLAQRLNHVEFVHPPGERALVFALFELVGIETVEVWNGDVVLGLIDRSTFDEKNNDNYLAGREVRPEQWAFDQELSNALRQEPLAGSYAKHKELLSRKPQWGMHFGIHLTSLAKWEAAVARITNVEDHAPALSGRVKMLKVSRPEDPEPVSALHQAFFWTDVIASGSLALGQRIELAAWRNENEMPGVVNRSSP